MNAVSMNATRPHRLLVIGANGFIGAAIVRAALDQDLAVAACSRAPLADPPPAANGRITHHLGGLTAADAPRLAEAMRDVDVIVHAAGLAHRTRGVTEAQFREVNVDGARVVLDAAVRARVPHVVLISSVAVYGRGAGGASPPDEGRPYAPATAYARSKLEGEQVATALAAQHGVRLTIVRPATVFGEGDPGSVAQLARLLRANRFIWIGSGTNRKSLTHVDDLAAACVRLACAPGDGAGDDGGAACQIYNIAGPAVSMRDVVVTLADALGRPAPRIGIPDPVAHLALRVTAPLSAGGDLFKWLPDRLSAWLADDVYAAAKYEARFGPVARMDWREGLRREAAWLLASAPARADAARPR